MASNEGFDEDPLSCGGYSQLMDSDMGESFIYSPSTFHSVRPPTMLCFGNLNNSKEEKGVVERGNVTQKSGITGSDSSSNSSSNNSSSSNSFTKSKRDQIEEPIKAEQERRNGSGSEPNLVPLPAAGAGAGSRRTSKKAKKENPNSSGPVKKQVRKEKLGERITALQQLVSPFGKTDTASVLHEAMGYIRFLHDQVQVLSSPYLQKLPSSAHFTQEGGRRRGEVEDFEGKVSDLRSRGLCLVPVEYTLHVGNCNGADLWSPAAMGSNSSSCSKN